MGGGGGGGAHTDNFPAGSTTDLFVTFYLCYMSCSLRPWFGNKYYSILFYTPKCRYQYVLLISTFFKSEIHMCIGWCVNDSVSDYANSINHWYQKHGPRQSSHTGCPRHYPILTFWHDNSGDSSGSNSRADGVSLLVDIDLPVPASPCSGGGKHPTTSTHVSKSSLAGPVGTTSPYTGNTGHSSSCTPGLSWSLVTLNRDQ